MLRDMLNSGMLVVVNYIEMEINFELLTLMHAMLYISYDKFIND